MQKKTTNPTTKKRVTQKVAERKESMLKALELCLGNVTNACKKIRLDRSTHYAWLKTDSRYALKVKELEDVSLDFAEDQLYKRMKKGSDACIIFYLKTKGKNRGYIERIEHVNKEVETFEKTEEEILKEIEQIEKRIK